jgi:nitrilase
VAPDTHYVTEPVYDVECLVLGDLDLEAIDAARLTLDVDGHYSRPDLFTLNVDRNPQTNVADA